MTRYVWGVRLSDPNSLVSSNGLPGGIDDPDPGTGQPSTSAEDQESYGYDATGRPIWKREPAGTEHEYTRDKGGNLLEDRATVLAAGVDGAVRRISPAYDALGRLVSVKSHDAVSGGTTLNEVAYEYAPWGVLTKEWQESEGAVSSSSASVSWVWTFPGAGSEKLRPANRGSCQSMPTPARAVPRKRR